MRTLPNINFRTRRAFCGAITATKTSRSIDTLGAEAVYIEYEFGATTSGTSGTVTLTLEDSADDSSFAAISGVTLPGALATDGGAQNAKLFAWIIAQKKLAFRRYVRVVLTVAGTVNTAATVPENSGLTMVAGPLNPTLALTAAGTGVTTLYSHV